MSRSSWLRLSISCVTVLSACADGRWEARRRPSPDVTPAERYGIDSARLSGSTERSAPDTARVPTLEVVMTGGSILMTDDAGRRTNSVVEPEDVVLEEIPGSYGGYVNSTDVSASDSTASTGSGATVGVPARPGARYRVELTTAAGGRDSATVMMAVGGGPVMRSQVVPFEVPAGGKVRFEIVIGASDYRVGDVIVPRGGSEE